MDLPDIPKVNEEQAAFGAQLGLSLLGQPLAVARARVDDVVGERLLGLKPREPTMRQLELLDEWDMAQDAETIGVASALIGCALMQLDMSSVRDQELEPGVTVINWKDPDQQHRVISSIKPWGLVYFKGGRGAKAPARSLERVWEVQSGAAKDGAKAVDRGLQAERAFLLEEAQEAQFEVPEEEFERPQLTVVRAR